MGERPKIHPVIPRGVSQYSSEGHPIDRVDGYSRDLELRFVFGVLAGDQPESGDYPGQGKL